MHTKSVCPYHSSSTTKCKYDRQRHSMETKSSRAEWCAFSQPNLQRNMWARNRLHHPCFLLLKQNAGEPSTVQIGLPIWIGGLQVLITSDLFPHRRKCCIPLPIPFSASGDLCSLFIAQRVQTCTIAGLGWTPNDTDRVDQPHDSPSQGPSMSQLQFLQNCCRKNVAGKPRK